MKNIVLIFLASITIYGCSNKKLTKEELASKDAITKLNSALVEVIESQMAYLKEQAANNPYLSGQSYKKAMKLKMYCDQVRSYELSPEEFESFVKDYNKAMNNIIDMANSNKFTFFMQNVEPNTKILPTTDVNSKIHRDLLVEKMKNDVIANTLSVINYCDYESSFRNIFGYTEPDDLLKIDTTGLSLSKKIRLNISVPIDRKKYLIKRDMVTIMKNGKDVTKQADFQVNESADRVVAIIEMKDVSTGDYELAGTFDIYFQLKKFVLHQPFNFTFSIQ